MPTFPSPPLKFRTAGFPRYGFKAGLSEQGLPGSLVCHLSFVLSAFTVHSRLCVRDDVLMSTSAQAAFRFTPGALAPDRVMLSRSIFA